MGSWGSGVFESDASKDLVADIIEDFSDEVEEALDSYTSEASYQDSDDSVLVLVALIQSICEKAGSAPPELETVQTWKKKYVKAFDMFGRSQRNLEAQNERKKVVVKCFESLIVDSTEFWSED